MIIYKSGDLLKSNAEALVNTVNCEGYMGKGIAYQFKTRYPLNYNDYVKACKEGNLFIGKLHYYKEKGKIIINFPTKVKWREKSRIDYIEKGLDQLIKLILDLEIGSIAIPPLGCGNGGLLWTEVKALIEKKLSILAKTVDINIFELSENILKKETTEPKLSASAIVLMDIKENLDTFGRLRLQKTAYFVNIFSHKRYFKFKKYKFGPYDFNINIVSNKIREFQKYHNIKDTGKAKTVLYNKIISEKVEKVLSELRGPIKKASTYVNSIKEDHELECLSTICFLIERNGPMCEEQILDGFKLWSEDKAARFDNIDILKGIEKLEQDGIIEENLAGYFLFSSQR